MRRAWMIWVLSLTGLGLLSGLVAWRIGPRLASAYYVERGGRLLADSPASARQVLAAALRWRPDNAQAYRLVGASYVAEGQWLLAADAFSAAAERQPGNPAIHWEWAHACDEAGQLLWVDVWPGGVDAAAGPSLKPAPSASCGTDSSSWQERLVAEWRAASVTSNDWVAQGEDTLESGDPAAALNAYQRALWLDPSRSTAWIGMGAAWEAVGEPDRALAAFASALTAELTAEGQAEVYALRGAALAEKEQWTEAAEELASAVELDPERAAYHSDLGWYLYQDGSDTHRAAVHLEQARLLEPQNLSSHLRLAIVYRQEGDFDRAIQVALEAAELVPESPWPWLSLAQTRRRQGRLPEAVSALEQGIVLRPEEVALHLELARILEEMGDVEGARRTYGQVLSLEPDHAEARQRLEALRP